MSKHRTDESAVDWHVMMRRFAIFDLTFLVLTASVLAFMFAIHNPQSAMAVPLPPTNTLTVSSITTSNFTVNIKTSTGAAGATQTVYWNAEE